MSNEKPLDSVKEKITGAATDPTPSETGNPKRGPGRPPGSGTKKKLGSVPVSIRGNSQPPPDPEQIRQQSMFAVAILIGLPITALKLEPYSPAEEKMMGEATLPVLEKYAGEMLVWMGPELALFGVAMMVLGPKIQLRRQQIRDAAAAEKSKESAARDNLFAQT